MIRMWLGARLTCALLTLGWGVGALAPTVAHAGTLAVISCELADGSPAPTEGWSSGWTGAPLPFSGSSDSCNLPGGFLGSYLGAQTAQPSSAGPFWEYTAPPGFSLVGGQVSATFDVPGASAPGYSAASGLLGPKFEFDAADLIGGLPGGMTGMLESTWSLGAHVGGHLWLYAFCEPPGSTCPAGGSVASYWSADHMKQAILELSNDTLPTGSAFAGPLAASTPVAGTAALHLQAADSGSGVYRVRASLDGQEFYGATPSANGGKCVALGTYGGRPEFTSATPCPESVSVTIPLDTTKLQDGSHELVVVVQDAAGNEAAVYSREIETHNAPMVVHAPEIDGVALVGARLSATSATFVSASGAGAVTGQSAQWLRCSDTNASRCTPIRDATGATYEVKSADVGYYLAYRETASNADGTTSVDSPPTLIVTAGRECGAAACGGTPRPRGSKGPWRVTLTVKPAHVHRGTTITLAGEVTTAPRPASGKLIYLQARGVTNVWRGRGRARRLIARTGPWITFQALRTTADGRWRDTYTFRLGGRHTYQMRAVAPQEGAYLNVTGASAVRTIAET